LRSKRQIMDILSPLETLDPKEVSVLREFDIQNRSTIMLPTDDPVVAGLTSKRIIQPIGRGRFRMGGGLVRPCQLPPVVKAKFTELYPLPVSDKEKQRINFERPEFISEMLKYDR
jgi:hypothetical protein